MRFPIRWKIVLFFASVVLVSSLITGWQMHRGIQQRFTIYIQERTYEQTGSLVSELKDYYEEHGSWKGIASYLDSIRRVRRRKLAPLARNELILLDEDDRVVWSAFKHIPPGSKLPKKVRAISVPIQVDGKEVGKLVVLAPSLRALNGIEYSFLKEVDRTLISATVMALAVALILGVLISDWLTRPLGSLAEAAHRITQGNLSQRVNIRSNDELGDVGSAFNLMASTLEKDKELREKLLTDVAHELRTPLSVIKGNLEAILDGVYEPTDENLSMVYDEVLLLERLINDLREVSLAEAGELRLDISRIDIEEIVLQSVGFFKPQAEEKRIEIKTDMAPRLPNIKGDQQRIRQVLHNLLSNAIRHTPEGGKIEVRVRTIASPNKEVSIAVADTGTGISPEDLPHVFERFYRGDPSRARESGGTGLGLVIAKELVEAHGGRIWIKSTPGRGTTVTFTLPVEE